jgi:hypothetical protein
MVKIYGEENAREITPKCASNRHKASSQALMKQPILYYRKTSEELKYNQIYENPTHHFILQVIKILSASYITYIPCVTIIIYLTYNF